MKRTEKKEKRPVRRKRKEEVSGAAVESTPIEKGAGSAGLAPEYRRPTGTDTNPNLPPSVTQSGSAGGLGQRKPRPGREE
jgi:hypothetical protein